MNPDLLTDEELQHQNQRGLLQPDPTFLGRKFWPMSHGSELLFENIKHEEDSIAFRVLAFLFIHLQRGGKTFEEDSDALLDLAWNPPAFRRAILQLAGGLKLTHGDGKKDEGTQAAARKFVTEQISQARRAEVHAEAEVTPGAPAQKKTEGSPRAKRLGSSSGEPSAA